MDRQESIQEVVENLKYLISGDCTDTQSDYVDEIETAIRVIEKFEKIKHIVDRPTGNNAEEKAYNYMMIIKDIKEVLEQE